MITSNIRKLSSSLVLHLRPQWKIPIRSLDSEIVKDSEPLNDMTTTPLYEHQQEMVFDSKDKEMHSIEVVNVAKGLMGDQIGRTVTNHSIEFQKKQLEPLEPLC